MEDSKALDSAFTEARFAVNKLAKAADGTTLVHYYFADDTLASSLCKDDPDLREICRSPDSDVRKAANAAMDSIVKESGAKIRFLQTQDPNHADVTFVQHPAVSGEHTAFGSSERFQGTSFIVINPDEDKNIVEQVAPSLRFSPAEIASELARGLKSTVTHEMEHILGAKHISQPDESNPKTIPQKRQDSAGGSIMNGNFFSEDRVLGPVDVAWYQRHFGRAESVSSSKTQSPPPTPASPDATGRKR